MTDDGPRAIVTVYKGYRFRSRLEARWAVFFDALGVRWEYEVEGYDLSGIWYLPDFWMPELNAWIEIKGLDIERNDDAWVKARELAGETGKLVYVFCGQIRSPGNSSAWEFWGTEDDTTGHSPNRVWWYQCPICQKCQLGRNQLELPCGCLEIRHPDEDEEICRAFDAARQADFRHGGLA
jgi:hypothetical protein